MKIVTPNMCGWGSYDKYEGSFWIGQYSYQLPKIPDFWDKTLAVISATEGCIDSVNAYDRCLISLSLIQLCDGGFMLSTNLLGYIADKLGPLAITSPLSEALKSSNATFKKIDGIGWRFQFLDADGKYIDNIELQKQLYFKCSGLRGSWNLETKKHVKLWVSGLANIWHNEDARKLQIEYVKSKLNLFISPSIKKELFINNNESDNVWLNVAKAAYISFSINNPTNASKIYFKFIKNTKDKFGTKEWTINLIKSLTFDSNIKIYTTRYNKIRPVLENVWKVKLPNTTKELKEYSSNISDSINDNSTNLPMIEMNQLLIIHNSEPPANITLDDYINKPLTFLEIIKKIISIFFSFFKILK